MIKFFKFDIGNMVSFSNGLIELTGEIKEARTNGKTSTYWIKVSTEEFYLIKENKLTLLESDIEVE